MTTRSAWVYRILAIIAAGILSRLVHTGYAVFDKYPGDALYAMMLYCILRLFREAAAAALGAMAIMTALESFQLTMIPAQLHANENAAIRLCARLLGTEFGFGDLLAYAAGIACIYWWDSSQ